MEGRAFGTASPGSVRPWLEPWRWQNSDNALLLATALALGALVLAGAAAHTLRPIWG